MKCTKRNQIGNVYKMCKEWYLNTYSNILLSNIWNPSLINDEMLGFIANRAVTSGGV